MKKLLLALGSIIASIAILSIPTLATLSLVYDWHPFLSGIFIIAVVAEIFVISWYICEEVELE